MRGRSEDVTVVGGLACGETVRGGGGSTSGDRPRGFLRKAKIISWPVWHFFEPTLIPMWPVIIRSDLT